MSNREEIQQQYDKCAEMLKNTLPELGILKDMLQDSDCHSVAINATNYLIKRITEVLEDVQSGINYEEE